MLALFFQSCERLDEAVIDQLIVDQDCIEVSYVRGICGQAVLKILTPAYKHLGEKEGNDTDVFLTEFSCEDANKSTEGTFYIQLLEKPNLGDCPRCLAALIYNGKKKYNVRRVDTCNAG